MSAGWQQAPPLQARARADSEKVGTETIVMETQADLGKAAREKEKVTLELSVGPEECHRPTLSTAMRIETARHHHLAESAAAARVAAGAGAGAAVAEAADDEAHRAEEAVAGAAATAAAGAGVAAAAAFAAAAAHEEGLRNGGPGVGALLAEKATLPLPMRSPIQTSCKAASWRILLPLLHATETGPKGLLLRA